MGDMGCHHFDISFDALKLTAPLRVRQLSPGSSGPTWAKQRKVELVFPGSDMTAGDTVTLTWHDGEIRPDASRIQLPAGVDVLPDSGTYWIGESGSIFKNYRGGMPIVLPETNFPQSKYPSDIRPQDHYHDWVDAAIAGSKACDDFSHGGPLTEAVLVGAMADRAAGQWLNWDRRLKHSLVTNEPHHWFVANIETDGTSRGLVEGTWLSCANEKTRCHVGSGSAFGNSCQSNGLISLGCSL